MTLKTETLVSRATLAEKKIIQKEADRLGMTTSAFMLYLALKSAGTNPQKPKATKPQIDPTELLKFRKRLNLIAGSPLNQLAKWANIHKREPHLKYLEVIQQDLRSLKELIEKELKS